MEKIDIKDWQASIDEFLKSGVTVLHFETSPNKSIIINRQWLIEIMVQYLTHHKYLEIDRSNTDSNL